MCEAGEDALLTRSRDGCATLNTCEEHERMGWAPAIRSGSGALPAQHEEPEPSPSFLFNCSTPGPGPGRGCI